MPRGGSRPGAGRRPGRRNAKTLERLRQVEADGLTPLEVMLDNMRFAHVRAEEVLERIMSMQAGREDPTLASDSYKELMNLRRVAQDAAKDAAPYVHPRLAATVPLPPKEDAPTPPVNTSAPVVSFEEMAEIYGGWDRRALDELERQGG